jgi:hypothetical protein
MLRLALIATSVSLMTTVATAAPLVSPGKVVAPTGRTVTQVACRKGSIWGYHRSARTGRIYRGCGRDNN